MSGIEFFEPMERIPETTHNDLLAVRRKSGKASIVKSDGLKAAESVWESHLARYAPQEPLDGPVGIEMRICFPTGGSHGQGSPMCAKPDADNVEKTVFDVMARLGFMTDDAHIALHTTAKLWSDPSGIYVRMRGLPG